MVLLLDFFGAYPARLSASRGRAVRGCIAAAFGGGYGAIAPPLPSLSRALNV